MKLTSKNLSLVVAIVVFLSLSIAGISFASGSITQTNISDIKNHWAEKQIQDWIGNGYISGYPDGGFKPDKDISRAEIVKLINKVFKINVTPKSECFSDVKASDWFFKDIACAQKEGYITGYPNNTFKPNNRITREEVAVIITRLLKLNANKQEEVKIFSDVNNLDWSRKYIDVVTSNKIMQGYLDGTFKSKNYMTRAEAVFALDKALRISSTSGEIRGIVKIEDKPVNNALVKLYAKDDIDSIKQVSTDVYGKYAFSISEGTYDLTVIKDSNIGFTSDVTVTENQTTEKNITLTPGVKVTGKIVDKNGISFNGIKIYFTTNPTFDTSTDDKGKFSICLLKNRNYIVRYYATGQASEDAKVINANVQIGDNDTDLKTIKADFSIVNDQEKGSGSGGGAGNNNLRPNPPVLNELSEDDNTITLSWDEAISVDYYKVKRSIDSVEFNEIADNIIGTSYTDSSIESNKTYYYTVTSVKNGKESVSSNIRIRMLAPQTPTISGLRDEGEIRLNWTKPVGAENYDLYRSTISGGPYYILVENTILTQYSDTNIQADSTYYYVIKAKNTKGTSDYSNELSMPANTQQGVSFDLATDSDGDGLTNEEELEYGTDIYKQDTDRDGLSDSYEINIAHTDALNPDTDKDDLYDGAEIVLGTNPLVKDNNNIETSRQAETQIKSSNNTILMDVEVNASGDGNLSIAPLQVAQFNNVIINSLDGIVGKAVSISSGGYEINSASLKFEYDTSILGDVDEDNLTIFWVDMNNKKLVPLSNIELNKDTHTVSANTTHFSTYLLGDKNMPLDLTDVDIVFCIDQSWSMETSDPEFYRLSVVKDFVEQVDDLNDRIAIVEFGGYASTKEDLTSDKASLIETLNGMEYMLSGTNIRASLTEAESLFNIEDNRRKIVVLLTDGQDNYTSTEAILNKSEEMAEENIIINTIALGGDTDQELLEEISDMTGGEYFFINDQDGLSQEDVNSQMEIIYRELTTQIVLADSPEEDLTGENVTPIQFSSMYSGVDFEETLKWMTDANSNLLTGNFTQNEEDLKIIGSGSSLLLERAYNSDSSSEQTIIGNGWRLNYDSKIDNADACKVTAGVLNVHKTPWGDIIAKVANGTELKYIKRNAQEEEGKEWKWQYVRLPGGEAGYVAGCYIQDLNGVKVTYSTGSKIVFEEDNGAYISPYGVNDTLEQVAGKYILTKQDQSKNIYDAKTGKLLSIEDVYGNALSIQYVDDKISSVKDSVGRSITFSYAGEKISQITDPIGRNIKYDYDSDGNLIQVTDVAGNKTKYEYYDKNSSSPAKLKKIVDANEHQVVKNEYDRFGRIVKQYDGNNHVKCQIYNDSYNNKNNQQLERIFINENGYESRISLNIEQKPIKEIDSDGKYIRHQYFVWYNNEWKDITDITDKSDFYQTYCNQVKKVNVASNNAIKDQIVSKEIVTDKNGNSSTFVYDARNNLREQTDAYGNKVSKTYNDQNSLLSVTDKKGNTTNYEYDLDGIKLLKETDPYGNTVEYQYYGTDNQIKVNGLIKSIKDKNDNITTDYYTDTHNNLTAEVDSLGNQTTYVYDDVARKTLETNAKGYTTQYQYDKNDRIVKITDAKGNFETCTYDTVGNLVSETDKNGNIKTNEYNEKNQLIKVINPVEGQKTFEYDNAGNKIKETNELGRETRYSYDAMGRIKDVTNAKGGILSYQYDYEGNKTKETDELGRETSFVYDNINRLTKIRDALSNEEEYSYDKNGNKISYQDKDGNITYYQYDKLDRCISVQIPNNAVTYYQFDKNGNQTRVTDALGRITSTEYDAMNRPNKITDALLNCKLITYDELGRKKEEKDENDNVTKFDYDELGRLTRITDAKNNVEQMEYDAVGNNTAKVDKRNYRTEFTYNELNQLIETKDAEEHITGYEYDSVGNKTAFIDSKGNRISYVYDVLNRQAKVIDQEGNQSENEYDAVGNKIKITDANGNVTSNIYDDLNRLIKVIDEEETNTVYKYDAKNNIIQINDGENNIEYYQYNSINKLIKKTDAREKYETYTYDTVGNLETKVDRNGTIIRCEYDALNRLVKEEAGEITNTYNYDKVGSLKDDTNASGKTTYTYDELNRMIKKTYPNTKEINYEYDEEGNVKEVIDPAGGITNYTYDSKNRMSKVEAPQGDTIYEYDENGNRSSLQYPNGTRTEYQYNDRNQLIEMDNIVETSVVSSVYEQVYGCIKPSELIDLDNGNVLLKYRYLFGYDNNGSQIYKIEPDGRTDITYDGLNRVETVSTPDGKTVEYTYDRAGNRKTETVTDSVYENDYQITYFYDENNRLLSFEQTGYSPKTALYEYDDNGNQVEISDTVDGSTTFTYDELNRLISTVKNEETATYTYNSDGVRNTKQVGGVVTTFYYSGKDVLYEEDSAGKAFSNVHGINLILRSDGTKEDYYLYNGHADVIMMVESDGSIENVYNYDTFGNIVLDVEKGVSNPFRYAEYYYDSETKNYYLKSRYYDANTARFLTEDSYIGKIEDPLSLNRYTYCDNEPVMQYDPDGHFAFLVPILIGAASSVALEATEDLIEDGKINHSIGTYAFEAGLGATTGTVGMGAASIVKLTKFKKVTGLFGVTRKGEIVGYTGTRALGEGLKSKNKAKYFYKEAEKIFNSLDVLDKKGNPITYFMKSHNSTKRLLNDAVNKNIIKELVIEPLKDKSGKLVQKRLILEHIFAGNFKGALKKRQIYTMSFQKVSKESENVYNGLKTINKSIKSKIVSTAQSIFKKYLNF